MIQASKPAGPGQFTFEAGTWKDATEATQAREQMRRAKKNGDWLQNHWDDVLPQARGRFVAVAGQQAYVADTAEAAWAWAAQAHPEDDGAVVQYVPTHTGPRIYANHR